jgi:predicted transcriptional regulator
VKVDKKYSDLLLSEMDKLGTKEVARLAGLTRATLYNVLKGAAGDRTVRKLEKLLHTKPRTFTTLTT